jgi:hypothetical protein
LGYFIVVFLALCSVWVNGMSVSGLKEEIPTEMCTAFWRVWCCTRNKQPVTIRVKQNVGCWYYWYTTRLGL